MRRVLIALLIAILLAVAWWFLLGSRWNERTNEARVQLEQEENIERDLQRRLAALQVVADNTLEYQTAVDDLRRSIPPTPQMDVLIDELSTLAGDSGVIWESATYSNPVGEPLDSGIREILMSIEVEGQYFEILGYLYGIEEVDRLLAIRGVTFSAALDDDGFNIISARITASAYTTGAVVVPEVPVDSTTTTTIGSTSTTATTSTTSTTSTTTPQE